MKSGLIVKNLSKAYSGIQAVRQISFKIDLDTLPAQIRRLTPHLKALFREKTRH